VPLTEILSAAVRNSLLLAAIAIDLDKFRVDGIVQIDISVNATTDEILLHAQDINITSAMLRDITPTMMTTPAPTIYSGTMTFNTTQMPDFNATSITYVGGDFQVRLAWFASKRLSVMFVGFACLFFSLYIVCCDKISRHVEMLANEAYIIHSKTIHMILNFFA
jgi:hypothetical protein